MFSMLHKSERRPWHVGTVSWTIKRSEANKRWQSEVLSAHSVDQAFFFFQNDSSRSQNMLASVCWASGESLHAFFPFTEPFWGIFKSWNNPSQKRIYLKEVNTLKQTPKTFLGFFLFFHHCGCKKHSCLAVASLLGGLKKMSWETGNHPDLSAQSICLNFFPGLSLHCCHSFMVPISQKEHNATWHPNKLRLQNSRLGGHTRAPGLLFGWKCWEYKLLPRQEPASGQGGPGAQEGVPHSRFTVVVWEMIISMVQSSWKGVKL